MVALSDIPNGPHWAIVSVHRIEVAGDGHNSQGYTDTVLSYIPYKTREEWQREIERRSLQRYGEPFKAMKVEPALCKVVVEIEGASEQGGEK